jgi:hypothetical protein
MLELTKTVPKTDEQAGVVEHVKILSPAVYDKLKKTVQFILPLIGSIYFGLGQIWGFPKIEEVIGSITVLNTALGSVVGISKSRADKADTATDGDLVITEDPGGVASWMMAFEGDPELLKDRENITFKVKKQSVYDPTP